MPYLAAISIYPIKSLDPVALSEAVISAGGTLQGDREFAIIDEQEKFINGKRNARIHQLRAVFDWENRQVSSHIEGSDKIAKFSLDEQRKELEQYLSDYFRFSAKLVQNQRTGFPDDTNAQGPTIISTATLETLANWFSGISTEEMRLRLRANLEIGGVPAFWEDQLFAQSGECVQFQIGEVLLEGINPCQRCVVPTRDSQTGKITPHFQKEFIAKRRETLPSWTVASRFNHFYRLSVNTNVPATEAGKEIKVGDRVKILDICKSQLS